MIPSALPDPCMPVHIRSEDGAKIVVGAHGGQVLGWIPAGSDRDRLWLSPLARNGPGEAIRGGIPVIFPQFASRGPLPKHGFARDRQWDLDTGSNGAPVARAAAELRDDEETRAIWPHRFVLGLRAEATGSILSLTLWVRNEDPDGSEPFSVTAALHAYLSVRASWARVLGLGGREAEDHIAGGAAVRLPDAPVPALGPVDIAFRGAPGPARLVDGLGGGLEVCCEGTDGFDSIVMWNPGPGHGIDDMPRDGASQFVCVEPARLTPISLEPRETWSAAACLTALVPNP